MLAMRTRWRYLLADFLCDLQTDWNDGIAVCSLVRALGGPVPGFKQLTRDPENWESNLDLGSNLPTRIQLAA